MGYPDPLVGSIRKIADNVVLVSTPFAVLNFVNLGARMALFRYDNKIVIWSPIKYGELFEQALELISNGEKVELAYIFVANTEHNMAAAEYKAHYPNVKIIASEKVKIGSAEVDYKVDKSIGSKVINQDIFESNLDIHDDCIIKNFELVYLNYHKNSELVVYEKTLKAIFAADVLMDIGKPNQEQYSSKTGYSDDYFPHTRFSYLTRYLRVDSVIGKYLMKRISKLIPPSTTGLQAIDSLPFEIWVPAHGNVFDKNPKGIFEDVFELKQPEN